MIISSAEFDYRLNFSYHLRGTFKNTSCEVEKVKSGGRFNKDGVTLGYGIAKCNLQADNFKKLTGRKMSLRRALNNVSKEERTNIWKAYFDKVKYS